MTTRSVRWPLRLRMYGKLTIDHIPDRKCRIEIETKAGCDNEVRVSFLFAGHETSDDEGHVHDAINNAAGGDLINERDGYLIGVGYTNTLRPIDLNSFLGQQLLSQQINYLTGEIMDRSKKRVEP